MYLGHSFFLFFSFSQESDVNTIESNQFLLNTVRFNLYFDGISTNTKEEKKKKRKRFFIGLM